MLGREGLPCGISWRRTASARLYTARSIPWLLHPVAAQKVDTAVPELVASVPAEPVQADSRRTRRRIRSSMPSFLRVSSPTGATSINPVQPIGENSPELSVLRTLPGVRTRPTVQRDTGQFFSEQELRRLGLSSFANGPPTVAESIPEEGMDKRTYVMQCFNTPDRWSKHRDSNRYWRHVKSVFSSSTFLNLRLPLSLLTLNSIGLTAYEAAVVRPCMLKEHSCMKHIGQCLGKYVEGCMHTCLV